MNKKIVYNFKNVDLVNLVVISLFLLASLICAFVLGNSESVIKTLYEAVPVEIVSILIYKLNIKTDIKAIIYSILLLAGAAIVTYLNETLDLSIFSCFFISIVIVSIYLKEKIILVHGILFNATWIILYIISPVKFLGNSSSLMTFLIALLAANSIIILLYF